MLDFLELEENVGRTWHRLVGQTRSMPRYPQEAVTLDEVSPILGTCFRGFGGDHLLQIVPAHVRTSKHRLRLRQLVGLGEERIGQPGRDFARVMLPAMVDFFPDKALNRDMYVWLSAAIAMLPDASPRSADPLLHDLARIATAQLAVASVLKHFPGLRQTYRRLCQATLAGRTRPSLPSVERLVEMRILSLLRAGAGIEDDSPATIFPHAAPAGYLPMMDVPLWPEVRACEDASPPQEEEEGAGSQKSAPADGRRLTATREKGDPGKRDPFILNRFEKILSMAEMVNVDRPTDDQENNDPSAADDLDEVVLGRRKQRPSSKFRFDLDLPPALIQMAELATKTTYPEWDYRKAGYLHHHCSVLAVEAQAAQTPAPRTPEMEALVRKVRRQFEAMRPRLELAKAQLDGPELDLDAVVRRSGDLRSGGHGSDRIHLLSRPHTPDLAVTILVDVSLSTDAWIDNLRVLDVEKEALQVLSQGLAACGTDHSILTFTSRRRSWVKIETIKRFDEAVSSAVEEKIAAITPGYYTRMGAAVRHATAEIRKRPNRTKLLLVLTDGKPNDVDHYEGRFALEDTRRAVQEARGSGVNVFAVTVDKDARSYLPTMFGRNNHAVVGKLSKLPAALPAIYRGLTS